MKRAYSPTEVQQMNIPSFPFEGKWEAAFGHPDRTGVWIIWGESGNGKSSFVMQLGKYQPFVSEHFESGAHGGSELQVQNIGPGTNG